MRQLLSLLDQKSGPICGRRLNYLLMAKKTTQRSFNDVLSLLGGQRFDVAPASEGASIPGNGGVRRANAGFKVSKGGCAAVIAEAPDGTVLMLVRPGWLLGGEISRIVDKGYQKFLATTKLEVPATADHLRALHLFSEELNEAAGGVTLYNQSLGTTSDSYLYDRVKGRE